MQVNYAKKEYLALFYPKAILNYSSIFVTKNLSAYSSEKSSGIIDHISGGALI